MDHATATVINELAKDTPDVAFRSLEIDGAIVTFRAPEGATERWQLRIVYTDERTLECCADLVDTLTDKGSQSYLIYRPLNHVRQSLHDLRAALRLDPQPVVHFLSQLADRTRLLNA